MYVLLRYCYVGLTFSPDKSNYKMHHADNLYDSKFWMGLGYYMLYARVSQTLIYEDDTV